VSLSPSAVPALESTRVHDGRLLRVLDRPAAGTNRLEGFDNAHGLVVGNLAEHDVAAIKPAGLDRGDEELRAVAVMARVSVLADLNPVGTL